MAETFGKTDKGGSELSACGKRIWGCKFQSGSAGDLASISVYLKKNTGTKAKCAIYDSDFHPVANGTTEEKTIDAGQDGFLTFNFGETKPSVAASTDYWLCIWHYSTFQYTYMYYAAGALNQLQFDNETYNSWPDPFAETGTENWELSIYATYEEAPPAVKTLVQAALISIPPLIVLPTLAQVLKFA